MSQSPQYNQSRQSQSSASRENVSKETDQELGIFGNTGTITTIIYIIFRDLFLFYQIFLSLQLLIINMVYTSYLTSSRTT